METSLRILDTPDEMSAVEELQRLVWTGSETEVVPVHMLLASAHNGGLIIGAFDTGDEQDPHPLVGFVFGFPGIYSTPDGPRLKHCSHMMGVHPDFRDSGLGFALKRAQWQMVRHQGLDRITWTYDPLLSRNAHLNIGKLGAVCNTYLCDEYGALRDGINRGLSTDRFQVDWWVNSQRVNHRLGKQARRRLDLAHYFAAGAEVINPSQVGADGWPHPASSPPDSSAWLEGEISLLLVEIPPDFLAIKAADPALAIDWRNYTRSLFEELFDNGYLATDFVYLPGSNPRSFYVLSHGNSIL